MADQSARNNVPSTDSHSTSALNVTKFTHVWHIENFSFFLERKSFYSPNFSAEDNDWNQWYLELYPKGSDKDNQDYIQIYLNLRSCRRNGVAARFDISIISPENEPITHTSGYQPYRFNRETGWGTDRFIRLDSLLANHRSYMPDDRLTLSCKISYMDTGHILSHNSREQSKVQECDLSAVLGEVLVSQKYCDVVLVLNGKEFPAHRAILAARSPVFKTMLERDLEAAETAQIEISDMVEETLKELLRFIYTGKSDATGKMTDLLAAIDKHAVPVTSPFAKPSEESSRETSEIAVQTETSNPSENPASKLNEDGHGNLWNSGVAVSNSEQSSRYLTSPHVEEPNVKVEGAESGLSVKSSVQSGYAEALRPEESASKSEESSSPQNSFDDTMQLYRESPYSSILVSVRESVSEILNNFGDKGSDSSESSFDFVSK